MKSNIVMKVRNIGIGFFVLVFIMGFFSKSIVNLFLPKVIVENAIDGLVERTLNIEGVIKAKKSFRVRLGGDVIVEEYFVKTGDVVEVGKPLFRIDKSYGIKGNSSAVEMLKLQIEAKRLRFDNLRQISYEVDEKNIAAMERSLDRSKEDLAKQQELFMAGVIAKQELEACEANLEQQMFDIEVSKLQLQEKKKNDGANLKELSNEIKNDELQMVELQMQKGFYGSVDNEGIYYSLAEGVISDLADIQSIIPGDAVIVEIADISQSDALIYTANITEEDYDFVKSAGSIEIIDEGVKDRVYLKITSINKLNDTGMYQVEASIGDKSKEKINIGQKLKGAIKQRFILEGHNKVPKAAVINFEGYKEGSNGTVYLLEENEGVLGMEYRAKEMKIKILAAGDNEVVVSGLENIEEPRVIINLSYKINNGAKVFLWQ